ncbi:hypothetical protein BGW80DRAFT_1308960 [Lactifluus volemus]|nr:hypothetical protein BGW80DRAFT_1308960 [Lactifluus volemus]
MMTTTPLFSTSEVTSQGSHSTALAYAIVNLKSIVPGRIPSVRCTSFPLASNSISPTPLPSLLLPSSGPGSRGTLPISIGDQTHTRTGILYALSSAPHGLACRRALRGHFLRTARQACSSNAHTRQAHDCVSVSPHGRR